MACNTKSIPTPFCLALVQNRQTKTALHLSIRGFCDNFFDFDAAWLTPSKEKANKLAKKSNRETVADWLSSTYLSTGF